MTRIEELEANVKAANAYYVAHHDAFNDAESRLNNARVIWNEAHRMLDEYMAEFGAIESARLDR